MLLTPSWVTVIKQTNLERLVTNAIRRVIKCVRVVHLYLVELAIKHVGRCADQPIGLVDADLGHALQLHGGSEALRSPVSGSGRDIKAEGSR